MKSRGLQFLCSVHTIYVALPHGIFLFFLSWEGRRVETELNLVNLLYVNSTRTWAWSRLENGFILSLPPAAVVLSLEPGTPGGSPRPLLGFQKIKMICITTLRYYLLFFLLFFFFTVLTICINSARSIGGWNSFTSAIKAATPTCTGSEWFVFLITVDLLFTKHSQVHWRMSWVKQ